MSYGTLKCPSCGHEVSRILQEPYETALEKAILDASDGDWSDWSYYDASNGQDGWGEYMDREIGHSRYVPGYGNVTLVDTKLDHSFDYAKNPVYLVVQLDDGRTFRKDGYKSSYGEEDWSGPFTEVRLKKKEEKQWVPTN